MSSLGGEALSYAAADVSRPVLDSTIGAALRTAAARSPDGIALVEGSVTTPRRRWSFADLLRESEQVARALLVRFAPGDHVAIWSANSPEWILVEFGAALAGLTLVTVNPVYLADELAFVLRQSRSVGIIVQDVHRGRNLRDVVESVRLSTPGLHEIISLGDRAAFIASGEGRALPDVSPRDIAQIQYTSGTTGAPKGARLTHRSLSNNGRLYAETIGARAGDVWINPMPLFHTAGCGLCTLGALQTGGTQVLPSGFDPDLMLQLFEEEHGTLMICVPTMLIRMLDAESIDARDLSAWRLVTLGGAPVPPELIHRVGRRGVKGAIGFGQTEASPYITHTRPDDPHPDWVETVGAPMPQTEIKIVDVTTGATAPVGTVGEICARGYSIMTDYFDNPDATRAAIDPDGWLHTGDLGSLDEYGYLRIQGRAKDMIIRGGENIYPREIEDVLFTHPAIQGVSVVGIPDREWGEIPIGFVQFKPGETADADSLARFCRERLASYKVPRIWRFVDKFPQTASGKIQKFALRDTYLTDEKSSPAS